MQQEATAEEECHGQLKECDEEIRLRHEEFIEGVDGEVAECVVFGQLECAPHGLEEQAHAVRSAEGGEGDVDQVVAVAHVDSDGERLEGVDVEEL